MPIREPLPAHARLLREAAGLAGQRPGLMQALAADTAAEHRSRKDSYLMSKLKALPALARATMADLETEAERLSARMAAVKARGKEAFGKWHDHLDAAESVVADAEDAINQLTNGAPGGPLPGSPKPSETK